jgi:predicted nucleotidyltransferase
VSVVLFGSAAVGDHHGRFSDINVLCVLQQVTPRELAECGPIFRWWRELENPSPLLLSMEEVRNSTDCFPIEFHDIRERHRILYGEDVVSGLEIDDTFYRAQVEYELRSKLLRLRQKAVGVLSEKDMLRQLLADSLSTFCVLFRHVLILCGVKDAKFEKREIIKQAQEKFNLDPVPFRKLLDLREQKIKPRDVEPGALFEKYLEEIQRVVDAVDHLEK